MSDTLGGDFIYSTLSGDSGVSALTTAIYNARMIPETENSMTTVNFYMVGLYDARQEFFSAEWSVDCRAKEQSTSIALALAVRDAINRKTATVGGYVYHGALQIGGTIPPADAADVYNTPVTLTVRRK